MYPNTRDTGKIVWILGFVFRNAGMTLDGRLGQRDLFPRSVTDTHQSSSLVTFPAVERNVSIAVFFSFQRRKNCRRISSLDYDLTDERDMVGHWYINPLTGDNLYPVSTSRELFRFLSDP